MAENQNANETTIEVPAEGSFDTEALQGSMQQILSENLGKYVTCEFLIGTQMLQEKSGVLYSVGVSFIVLFDDINQVYIVCDIFSIKFVTFYYPENRPGVSLTKSASDPTEETAITPVATAAPTQPQAAQQTQTTGSRQQGMTRNQAAFAYTKRKTQR